KEISIEIGGTVAFTGSAKANETLVFGPPLKINMGYPLITVSASPYPDGIRIEGSVDLNISIGGRHKKAMREACISRRQNRRPRNRMAARRKAIDKASD